MASPIWEQFKGVLGDILKDEVRSTEPQRRARAFRMLQIILILQVESQMEEAKEQKQKQQKAAPDTYQKDLEQALAEFTNNLNKGAKI